MKPKAYSLGLTGYPLEHSLSPLLHQAALTDIGLAGSYRLFPVGPDTGKKEGLQALLNRMRVNEIHGLNVTVPHKQAVIPFLDELSPAAQAIGAVNSIYWHQGRLIGDNTDAPGFLADLKRLGLNTGQRGRALVLGAGGSARAVIYALSNAGWEVVIAARRISQAQELANSLSDNHNVITAIPLNKSTINNHKSPITLLVNTTPVGMWPLVEASPWPAGCALPPAALVYDLVYNPARTKLAAEARSSGLKAYGGLGMLVEQAALALQIWTGRPVRRAAMFAAVPSGFLDKGFEVDGK